MSNADPCKSVGVSAVVSLPTIFLAWKVNDISEWFRQPSKRDSRRINRWNDDGHNENSEEQTSQSLRGLARRAMALRHNRSPDASRHA